MSGFVILDLGYGNTDSIRLAFARLGVEPLLTADPRTAAAAERLVLPGVGAAGFAMARLADAGLIETLRQRDKPSLGICLGMQLLYDGSDEADTAGLGIVRGRVRQMTPSKGFPMPHMGWTMVDTAAPPTGLVPGDYVYFAHGFACPDGPATAARAHYGDIPIPAALRHGPWWGAQFHPERSSAAGASFLKAFLSA